MKIKSLVVISTALLLLAGCSTTSTMTSSSSSSMPGTTMGTRISDADIAAIVTNASQGEIDQGQVAQTKASSDEVRAFARMMVTDHTNALNQARSLFSERNISTSTSYDVANNLQSLSQQTISALNTYSGDAFDRPYIQSQIDMHQWLLNSLDNNLIPSESSRQLRDFLQTQRTAVAMHLDRARQIQGMMR